MDELVKKMNEIREMLKDMNVISCTIHKNEADVLVCNFADVPNMKGTTTYKLRDVGNIPYEKSSMLDGVVIHTYGTAKEMQNEFAEKTEVA